MSTRFNPAATNICCPEYAHFGRWTCELAQDIVLRYWSQGGTDQTQLEPYMMESFIAVCEAIDQHANDMWTIAWKAASDAPEEWRKQEGRR